MSSWCARARGFVRVILSGLLVFLGSQTSEAYAQEAREVLIDPEAADAVDPELWSTLQGLFRNIDLRLVDESRRAENLVARVVLSPHENGVTIVVFDPRRADRGVRREVSRTESATVFRETVAQVLLSVVEPMAERPTPAPPEPAPSPPLAQEVPRESRDTSEISTHEISPSNVTYFLGARTGLSWWSSDVMRPGFGAQLGARFERRVMRPLFALEALFYLPNDFDQQGVEGRLRATSLRAVSMAELWSQRGLGLEAGFALGTDLLVFDPQKVAPPLESGPTTRRAQPVMCVRLAMRVKLTRAFAFLLGGVLDVDLAPRRWAVQRGAEQSTVFETARFRPQFFAALDWTFAGVSKGQTP